MITTKSSFKGFVFTLDALFALIVAVASISILMYVHFSSTLLYTAPAAEASSLLQNLLQTSVYSASLGNVYASYLLNAWNGNSYSWPQFAGDQYHSSNTSYGPQAAYLLYTVAAANAITPVISVGSGVAAFASGNYLYVINATTGSMATLYPLPSASPIPVAPTIYKNEIIYATVSGYITAVSLSNALVTLWSTNIGAAASTPLAIENNYVVFGSSNSVYLLYPTNGTSFATAALPAASPAQPPAYANGEFIISTGRGGLQNYLYSYALNGNALVNVWSYTLSTSKTTPPSVNGSAIAVGSGSFLYTLTLGGNLIRLNTLPNTQIVGISSSPTSFYVETVNAIYGFSPSGNTLFSYPTQTNNQNSTPSTSSPMLYTLVSGTNFQGYNIQTGTNVWNITLPYPSAYTGFSNVALAYGNAYAANGNFLYVFGTYKSQPGDSLLQALAGMYLNNQSAYSNIMLNKIYNSTNTGIFINSTYPPSLKLAYFNGAGSYVNAGSGASMNVVNPMTIVAWVKLNGYSANTNVGQVIAASYGGAANSGYILSLVGPGATPELRVANAIAQTNAISSTSLQIGTWYQIVGTYSSAGANIYVNGALAGSGNFVNNALPRAALMIGTPSWCTGCGSYMNGYIINTQLYNTALKPAQIMQLFQAGQYGVPVNATNLVGWWPLNGDFNDYSGHYNLGMPTSVAYQSSNTLPASLRNAFQVSKAAAPLSIASKGANRLYNVSVVSWR